MENHIDRFLALEASISELKGNMAVVLSRQESIWKDLYGNGQPGLRDVVLGSIREQETRDEERKAALQDHQKVVQDALTRTESEVARRDNRRMVWIAFIGVIFTAIMALVALLAYLQGLRDLKSGVLKIPKITYAVPFETVYAGQKGSLDTAIPHNP